MYKRYTSVNENMDSTNIVTQQLLESLHMRLCRLEFQYLSGKGLKRGRDIDEREMLEELTAEYKKKYPNDWDEPYFLSGIIERDADRGIIRLCAISRINSIHADVKVCFGKPDYKYTIWIRNNPRFALPSSSSSDKREVERDDQYDSSMDCRTADDVLDKLLSLLS